MKRVIPFLMALAVLTTGALLAPSSALAQHAKAPKKMAAKKVSAKKSAKHHARAKKATTAHKKKAA